MSGHGLLNGVSVASGPFGGSGGGVTGCLAGAAGSALS